MDKGDEIDMSDKTLIVRPYNFDLIGLTEIEIKKDSSYVGAFQHPQNSMNTCDVFYQEEPHPVSKSRYFGMYYGVSMFHPKPSLFITEWQEDWVKQSAISDPDKDLYTYSRNRRDYATTVSGKNFIDGGSSYSRYSVEGVLAEMTLKDGKIFLDGEPCGIHFSWDLKEEKLKTT